MNLNGNHFKDISGTHGISGILYPPFKRDYGFYKYEGKGSKQPSTYTKQLNESKVGINLHLTSPGVAPQRRNGYSDSQPPIGEGILYKGVDFQQVNSLTFVAEDKGYTIKVVHSIVGWLVSLHKGSTKIGSPTKEPTLADALRTAKWILVGGKHY